MSSLSSGGHSLQRVDGEQYLCSCGEWGTVADADAARNQHRGHLEFVKQASLSAHEPLADPTGKSWANPFVISGDNWANPAEKTRGDQPA